MSKATTADVVGTARDSGDGRLKVMGAATYPIDVTLPGLASATISWRRTRTWAMSKCSRTKGVGELAIAGMAAAVANAVYLATGT